MKACRYHEYGGPDVLQLEEIDCPEPGRGEVLVEVRAAGINPVDTKFRRGILEAPELPMVPGSDFSGFVTSIGAGVTAFEEGDRVFGSGVGIDRQGACAEYALVEPHQIAQLPEAVSFEVGAAIPLVGITAFGGLIDTAGLRVGERCLIHGGNGGVGHLAVQLATAAGATVVTTAAREYHDELRTLGADEVFEYSRDEEELTDLIREVGPIDVILDHRLDEYLQLDTEVGAEGARIVGIDNVDPKVCYTNCGVARGKKQTLHHFAMITLDDLSPTLERISRLMSRGQLKANVAREYELSEVATAHESVLENSFLGKLIVST